MRHEADNREITTKCAELQGNIDVALEMKRKLQQVLHMLYLFSSAVDRHTVFSCLTVQVTLGFTCPDRNLIGYRNTYASSYLNIKSKTRQVNIMCLFP